MFYFGLKLADICNARTHIFSWYGFVALANQSIQQILSIQYWNLSVLVRPKKRQHNRQQQKTLIKHKELQIIENSRKSAILSEILFDLRKPTKPLVIANNEWKKVILWVRVFGVLKKGNTANEYLHNMCVCVCIVQA